MESRPGPPSCELRNNAADPGEGEQRARRSERRDQQALADELTHQHASSGAEREAGRHLLAALQRPRQEKTRHIRSSDEEQEHRGYARKLEEVENLLLVWRDPRQASADRFKAHSLKTGRVAVAFIAGHDAAAGDLCHDRRKQFSSGVSLSWFRQAAN